jgi:hypothetical protein
MLSAIAADPFWGPHAILELIERGWGLARGLEALIDACAELDEILAEIEDVTPSQSDSPTPQVQEPEPQEEEEEEEEDVPIGDLPLAWVDELDLLELSDRQQSAHADIQSNSDESNNSANDVYDALRRIAASWHLQPAWARAALWEALPEEAERRAIVDMLKVVAEQEGWCGERRGDNDKPMAALRQRRRSWLY